MTVKYRVSDFAKDLKMPTKKVLDELAAMGAQGKKSSSNLEENELNYLMEKFSRDNAELSLDDYLSSGKAPKAEQKPAAKKQAAPQAKADKPAEDKNQPKRQDKKAEPHKKREEKTVSLSELARQTGAKASAEAAQSVSVRRDQVTVDTRTVDMNVDRFDACLLYTSPSPRD